MPFLRTDHWRCAVVHAPIGRIAAAGSLDGFAMTLLPGVGDMRFLADPFGIRHDGDVHVFAEGYDYRDRHGVIVRMRLGADCQPVETRLVLREAHHLSYPVPLVLDGVVHLLPEASRSGRLSLYRACDAGLDVWERRTDFTFPEAAIDASPVFFQGRWWMFYAPPGGSRGSRQATLCAAWADRFAGPWTPHPANPLLVDRRGARPGGTPFVSGDAIVLPTQDCVGTYGAALRMLRLWIDPARVEVEIGPRIGPPRGLAPLSGGLHTLSALGEQTLIDVKRVGIGPRRHVMNVMRRMGRAMPVTW